MRHTVAPRNRTLFLEEADLSLPVPTVEDFTGQELDGIYAGDCFQGMAKMAPRSVQVIFADPPYLGKQKFSDFPYQRRADYLAWMDEFLRRAASLLRDTGALYLCCDWTYGGALQELIEKYLIIKNRITWQREKGRGAKRNWKNNMEDIWYAVKDEDQHIFNLEAVKIKKKVIAPYTDGKGRPKDWVETPGGERFRWTHPSNIWTDLTVPFWSMGENTPHPTQKPERLVERCLLASSNPGDLILDPFMGSGTTAVVAKRLKRRFLGFEINPDYVRLARKRLQERLEP
ncbi:MAG: DNA-methyltransferase [Limnochordia bacterium]